MERETLPDDTEADVERDVDAKRSDNDIEGAGDSPNANVDDSDVSGEAPGPATSAERKLSEYDKTLADSFPASDPPAQP